MRKIEVKIRQIIWAIKKSFNPCPYDTVIYKNEIYYIKPSFTGHNKWNLYKKDEKKYSYSNIKGKELKIFNSFSRFKRTFKEYINFQKTSWERIDCRNKIGTRLSYINSDNIKFFN